MSKINFYGLSCDEKRKENIKTQFDAEQIPLYFVEPVVDSDLPIECKDNGIKKVWRIMCGHLKMLKAFIDSDADYGIFCEDDIRLRKNMSKDLPEILTQFKNNNLGVLLLSYLCPFIPANVNIENRFGDKKQEYRCLKYGDDLWGTQMYMMNRETAQFMLEKYTLDYGIRSLTDSTIQPIFAADWSLTKDVKNRAMLYPMLAVELPQMEPDNPHLGFHEKCFRTHFHPDIYYS